MRKIENQEIFQNLNSRLYRSCGNQRYYTTEHHRFLQYHYPLEYENDNGMLLYCTLLCRTQSWTGDHHRRINAPFLNLGLIHSGETAIRSGEKFFLAEPGDVFVLFPDTDYELLTLEQCDRSAILMNGDALSGILEKSGLSGNPVFSLPDPKLLENCFDRLALKLSESGRHSVRREISNLCFELFQLLSAPEESRSYPEELSVVLEKLGREYMNPLGVEELALFAGVSPSGLSRLFKRCLHTTPYKYLVELRMRQAARLLEQHSLSVKEISERVGYNNPLNFSTEFRKHFGKSPKRFLS